MNHDTEKFEYFMERTKEDLDYIRDKVDTLSAFRWMILGGSGVISLLVSILVEVIARSQ